MNIISLLNFEEGFSEVPYYCSEGYPTIGIGKRIGPKGAPLSQYQFTVSKSVATVWMSEDVQKVVEEIKTGAATQKVCSKQGNGPSIFTEQRRNITFYPGR